MSQQVMSEFLEVHVIKHVAVLLVSLALAGWVWYTYFYIESAKKGDQTSLILNTRIPGRVIFGHVHMAKTMGTTINGEMAIRFRNVCGNKGYSLLEYQRNLNLQAMKEGKSVNPIFQSSGNADLMRFVQRQFDTSIQDVNSVIGYEECDYISQEAGWKFWPSLFNNSQIQLELHVPCREKLEHLLSMCNFQHKIFNCEEDIITSVDNCMLGMNRFSDLLVTQYPNIQVRCFSPEKLDQYYEYMEKHLVPRRFTVPYIFRPSNKPRNLSRECLHTNQTASSLANKYLESLSYYKFCDQCIGSKHDLLLTRS